MNLLKNWMAFCLIGVVGSYANAALSGGADGDGPFQSAIPTPYQTLKFSIGAYQSSNVGIDTVWNGSRGNDVTAAQKSAFSKFDMSFALNYGLFSWLETSVFMPYYTDKTPNGSSSKAGDITLGLKLNYPPYGNPGKRAYELSYLGQLVIPNGATSGPSNGLVRNAWDVQNNPNSTVPDSSWSPYNSHDPIILMSLLNTINFGAIQGNVPLMIHFNAGLALDAGSAEQQTTFQGSVGFEFWTGPYLGFFALGETQIPTNHNEKGIPIQKNPADFKGGVAFKLPVNEFELELSGGISAAVNAKPTSDYSQPAVVSGLNYGYAYSRQDKFGIFAGASMSYDFSDKDSDHDGVPDSKDKCPNTPEGVPVDSEGCPIPDSDGDGICDPWVSAKGMLNQFANICHGVDKCPYTPKGVPVDSLGCPDPDRDGDKVCDPWVSENGLLDQYSKICHGVDKCPDQPGSPAKDGCP